MEIQQKVIVISGPTASGKTSTSIRTAEEFDGEIVNCDSRQIYKFLDIGTAKESIRKRHPDGSVTIEGIRHHLIDLIDPTTEYTLADFQHDAFESIRAILERKNLPILVGGTGLYIDAVVYNYDLMKEEKDSQQRSELQKKSLDELQAVLQDISMDYYQKMNTSDRQNSHRLIRAIERIRTIKRLNSGSNSDISNSDRISGLNSDTSNSDNTSNNDLSLGTQKRQSQYDTLYLVTDTPEEILHKRIHERTAKMFDDGLLKENKELREKGYTTELVALQTIGYKEFDEYFKGNQSLEETRELIELHTRQYAKRQLTWFKRNKDAIRISDTAEAIELVLGFLSR
jgi:tRNA dimethylallyltransferase